MKRHAPRGPTAAATLLCLLVAGALAGCERPQAVVEHDTRTVVHDQPIIVHEDRDRHPGDDGRPPPPPPPPGGRHDDHRDDRR